ncbi:MAG TPA: hypothetical protein VEB18_03600 [Candidatus Paceibacterota bacterium]|nr:hypothetical protein [Candidatus Paceibacterota bacterium]
MSKAISVEEVEAHDDLAFWTWMVLAVLAFGVPVINTPFAELTTLDPGIAGAGAVMAATAVIAALAKRSLTKSVAFVLSFAAAGTAFIQIAMLS